MGSEMCIRDSFQRKNFDEMFQVVAVNGTSSEAKSYTLCDLHGNTEGLGFVQPVTYDRITPIEVLPIQHETEDQSSQLLIHDGGMSREATLVSQSLDGRVNIRYHDEDIEHTVDLSQMRYQWL